MATTGVAVGANVDVGKSLDEGVGSAPVGVGSVGDSVGVGSIGVSDAVAELV